MYGLAMVKGLMVTLKNLTKKPFTVQYPEERLQQHPRFRGEEFVWYEETVYRLCFLRQVLPAGNYQDSYQPQRDRRAAG